VGFAPSTERGGRHRAPRAGDRQHDGAGRPRAPARRPARLGASSPPVGLGASAPPTSPRTDRRPRPIRYSAASVTSDSGARERARPRPRRPRPRCAAAASASRAGPAPPAAASEHACSVLVHGRERCRRDRRRTSPRIGLKEYVKYASSRKPVALRAGAAAPRARSLARLSATSSQHRPSWSQISGQMSAQPHARSRLRVLRAQHRDVGVVVDRDEPAAGPPEDAHAVAGLQADRKARSQRTGPAARSVPSGERPVVRPHAGRRTRRPPLQGRLARRTSRRSPAQDCSHSSAE
jgi:hypothetical protein